MNTKRIFLTLSLILPLSLLAKEIRVSLLEDESVLNETANLFRQNGSSKESVEGFRSAVKFHNQNLRFDTGKFPKKKDGFYVFDNLEVFYRSMPYPFSQTPGEKTNFFHNTLVCLDSVVLLIKDTGAKAPKLMDDFASKYFAKYENRGSEEKPNYVIVPALSYTFYKDGRTLLYPANGYSFITGLNRSEDEVKLAISLNGERILPGEYKDDDTAINKLFATRNEFQRKDGLEFPNKIRVVTGNYVPMQFHYWAVDHIAVFVENNGKLIYVEKNGTRGPFVRIDFNDEKEIGEYIAHNLLRYSRDEKEFNYRSPVVVSVNDRIIHIARP